MNKRRRVRVALALMVALAACGGQGTSDDQTPPETDTTTARVGESIGVGGAIDRTRAVVGEAEDRLNTIDQLAPSE